MSLILNSRPLVVIPELAVATGLNEAIVLQQIHYWCSEGRSSTQHDGRSWVYNTYEQWAEQFPFFSESTIKRALTSLNNQGLVDVQQLNKSKHDRTNFYAINYGQVDEITVSRSNRSNWPDPRGQVDLISTETTTENTTDIKPYSSEVENTTPDQQVVKVISDAAVQTPRGEKWGNADDLKAAQWIYQKALINNPTLKEPSWTSWANTIRLMRQRDHRTHREICGLFDWASKDSFWCANVLCPATLRKQWDKLASKMLAAPRRQAAQGMIDPNDTSWIYEDWGY